jgi:hypothetical protein
MERNEMNKSTFDNLLNTCKTELLRALSESTYSIVKLQLTNTFINTIIALKIKARITYNH